VYRSPMPLRRGTSGGLRKRERQIASAVAVVAVVAVVFKVIFDDGVNVNRCVASASAPVVHILPARGGDVAPAAAARSSPGDSGGVGATPMSRVTTHGF
jgi:hypothetical protein